jgi:acetylxylan esterase
MYIYVPDQLAEEPPILVASHYCTGTASAYFNQLRSTIVTAADEHGFIIIFPQATGRNCWDVGSQESLSHDGVGDTGAIVQMVEYALAEYDADASRVYALGGSSGGMMTQALIGVYPDVFKAGVEISGVPCGCWAEGYDQGTPQWSGACAGGQVNKTPEQWGDTVRAMYPGYAGHRPRIQLWHGTDDDIINYNNFLESIEEWTNVLGLSAMPTATDMPMAGFTRQRWSNSCGFTVLEAWSQEGGTHSIQTNSNAILGFLGLEEVGQDPEDAACSGQGGAGGSSAQSGAGGMPAAGSGGMGGAVAGSGGASVGGGGNGMVAGSSGSGGNGGAAIGGGGIGGNPLGGAGSGGRGGELTMAGSGGGNVAGAGGSAAGRSGSPSGGNAGSQMTPTTPDPAEDDGCGCAVVGRRGGAHVSLLLLLAAAVPLLRRLRRAQAR